MATTATARLMLTLAAVATLLLASPAPVSGQPGVVPPGGGVPGVVVGGVPAPVPAGVVGGVAGGVAGAMSCTASLVSSFAPCLNFITNGTASPTQDCCRSLGALTKASAGCACSILTGSVPLGVPVNRTLAVSLPRACNSTALQLQCRDASSAQSPAPGPVADAPAPSMSAPLPPEAEVPAQSTPATPATPTATPPVSQGQTRSTVVPTASAAGRASSDVAGAAGFGLLIAIGAALMI